MLLGKIRGELGSAAHGAIEYVKSPGFIAAVAAPAGAAALTLLFVIPTVAPGVASWDTAEFQTVGPVLGTAHPTGYAAYVILGWLASIVLQPFGDPAYRMNLLQALLAALAIAGTVGIVQVLTGRRLIAMATGIALACTQLFWRLSTHADPHMFHVALVAVLFVVLLVWDKRRHSKDADEIARADRWLIGAAFVYGVAVANHSLALLLPPAIAIFVLVADWRVILRWRTVVACFAVLLGTIAIFFSELPIRAAMNAPLVYGHPDTWSGFQYVVLAEQFRGSLQDPFGDLPVKAGHVIDLMAGWLGPFGQLAVLGIGTSLIRRPRFVILAGLAAVATCIFSASYANADIERYYLVPLLVAYVLAGLAAADVINLIAWFLTEIELTLPGRQRAAAEDGAAEDAAAEDGAAEDGAEPAASGRPVAAPKGRARRDKRPADLGARIWPPRVPDFLRIEPGRFGWVALVCEIVVAGAIIYSTVGVVPTRQLAENSTNGAVSEAGNTGDEAWVRAILAPANQGGLPQNSVIMAWWSDSTRLWYGQKVLGLRPDIYIVDDRTRLDANLGEVQDVFNKYLGNRPLYTIRLSGGIDGLDELAREYDMQSITLGSGVGITQVIRRKGSQ